MPKKAKFNPVKRYCDTVEGCKMFVARETVYVTTTDTDYKPDPAVEGVWLVKNLVVNKKKGKFAPPTSGIILYMKGYKDPFGNIRETDDFEDVEV